MHLLMEKSSFFPSAFATKKHLVLAKSGCSPTSKWLIPSSFYAPFSWKESSSLMNSWSLSLSRSPSCFRFRIALALLFTLLMSA